MYRFLDWLDEAAGGLIRVAYLVWGVVEVAAYFGDGSMPRDLTAPQRMAIGVEAEELRAELQAAARQRQRKRLTKGTHLPVPATLQERGEPAEKLAERFGVGRQYVYDAQRWHVDCPGMIRRADDR